MNRLSSELLDRALHLIAVRLEDLMKLAPTDDEMLSAARWVLTQDCGEGFALIVKDAVTKIGFPHVAARF